MNDGGLIVYLSQNSFTVHFSLNTRYNLTFIGHLALVFVSLHPNQRHAFCPMWNIIYSVLSHLY